MILFYFIVFWFIFSVYLLMGSRCTVRSGCLGKLRVHQHYRTVV